MPKDAALSLPGSIGITGSRYATSGDREQGGTHQEKNTPPFFVQETKIGFIYNGTIANPGQLWTALCAEGIEQQLDNDTELHTVFFSINYNALRKKGREVKTTALQSAEHTMDKVMGSFAAVVTLEDRSLMGFRSPKGVRPLCYGVKADSAEKSYAFSSESLSLKRTGYRDITDVKPGEAILISPSLEVQRAQFRNESLHLCGIELAYFAKAGSVIDGCSVYDARFTLGEAAMREIGHLWPNIDVIVPVPRTPIPMAEGASHASRIPIRSLLEKERTTRIFQQPTQSERERIARETFWWHDAVKNLRVLLVEDSVIRGTNSRIVIEKARTAGAKNVHMLSIFPRVEHECRDGVNIAGVEELIAPGKTDKEIAEAIGADSIYYGSVEGFRERVGISNACMACVDGVYVTPQAAKGDLLIHW